MAFSFSKITSSVSKANSAIASINSLTKSANSSAAKLNRISTSVGSVTNSMNNIRGAIGSDLAAFGATASAKGFSAAAAKIPGQAFDPGKLDSLISNTADIGNVAAVSRAISQQIEGISNLGNTNINNALSQGLQSSIGGKFTSANNAIGSISNVSRTLSKVSSQFSSSVTSISEKSSIFNGFNISGLSSIVSSFADFGKLLNNPISVIARDVSQLVGAVGGQFDVIRQLSESAKDINPVADFLDLNFKTPWDSTNIPGGANVVINNGSAASKVPNPLRDHNHYNYIITLGILDNEEFNFPSKYRSSDGFVQKYIIKSSGGSLDKRYTTFQEDASGEDGNTGHAEYYLDNLNLDAVIAPNSNTGVALGTSITFDVVEPYSMGNFIEALIGSAATLGYDNYVNAPFCLKIDFKGYDEYGNSMLINTAPAYVPIMITKVDFSVQAKGSEYAVQAVPYSESALDDSAQTSKVQINSVGSTVHEVLSGDEKSVMSVFNERVQELETSETIIQGDRYIIAFPKTPDALVELVGRIKDQVAEEQSALTINAGEQQRREKGLAENAGDESTVRKQQGIENNSVASSDRLFNTLKSYALDINNMNEIGLSNLVTNTATGGQTAQSDQSAAYDEFGDVVDISNAETAPAEKARTTQFRQGETITSMIEKVIKKSDWAKEQATTESQNGVNTWFKIDTQVFLDKNPAAEKQVGSSPKIYVYSIIKYYPDEAKQTGATQRAKNTEQLKALAPKQYNYFYTGKNEDVLNFDIQFNNQFFMTAFGNFGQNGASTNPGTRATFQQGDEQTGSKVAVEDDGRQKNEPGPQTKEANNLSNSTGDESGDIKVRIAEQFHNTLINQTVDMVTAEMEIWGDPFFLPQQTGNYVGKSSGNPSVLDDGTMNYLQSEIFCVVNFNSPFDYQVNGATMEMPRRVPQFSGLFSIWAVTNVFSGGKYTQTLKMIRRRGQDDEATVTTKSITATDGGIASGKDTAPGLPDAANNSVNSTVAAADPCNLSSAVANLTAVGEDLAMSQSLFPANSTTGGDDIAFAAPVIQVGDLAFSPQQSTFPSAPRAGPR
jgi:hypothetical protein